jgi:O-antigen/teichoic acid export membrane protein
LATIPLYIILKKNKWLKWHPISVKSLLDLYKKAFELFIFNLSGAIFVYSPKFFVGLKLSYTDVALYDFAEKILTIAKIPIGIAAQALYPMNCHNKDPIAIKKQILFLFMISCALYPVLLIAASIVSNYIGMSNSNDSIILISILLLGLPLSVIGGFAGINFLIPFGYQRIMAAGSISTSIFFLIGATFLNYYENTSLFLYGWLTTAAELIFSIIVIILIMRHRTKEIQKP